MVGWAYLSPTVWSLLGGGIAGELTRMVLSHVALPGPTNKLRWEKEAARGIFDFGKWIFLSTLVTYLGLRFDSISLGKLVSLERLGVYNIGQSLANVPALITGQVLIWVLLPGLSEAFRGDREHFVAHVRRARRVTNAAGVLMIVATVVGAPAFFYLLYDPRYHDAGWMVQLLMLPTWFFFLSETSVNVQLAMGESRMQTLANTSKLIGTIPGALGGYWLGETMWGDGLPGLVLGLAIGAFIGYAINAIHLQKRGLLLLGSDMRWTLLAVALAVLGGIVPWIVGPVMGVPAPIVSLVIGGVVLAPYALWSGRLVLMELRKKA
jgi:O-antigen/teichoic acid export membrane protein